MRFFILIIILVCLTALGICGGICAFNFDRHCLQYLKRASDASTVELAKQNLEMAIKYLERNDLTSGVVVVFVSQPENDMGYRYANLTASLQELKKVTDQTTQLERSNILIKLRETLLDHTANGTAVTHPHDISLYPYQVLFNGGFIVLCVLLTISFGFCVCWDGY